MTKINLLPRREKNKRMQKQKVIMTLLAAVLFVLLLIGMTYVMITHKFKKEELKNAQAQPHIPAVDISYEADTLNEFTCASLKLTGTITQAGKDWALILAPDNIIYPVTTGEIIAKEHAKVSQINNDQINLTGKENTIIKIYP